MNLLLLKHQGNIAGSTFSIAYLAIGLTKRGHYVYIGFKTSSLLYKLCSDSIVSCIPMTVKNKTDILNMRQIAEMQTYKRILIIQTAYIGDVVLTIPLFQAVHNLFPKSKIDVLVIPQTEEIVSYSPQINQVLLLDKGEKKQDLSTRSSAIETQQL